MGISKLTADKVKERMDIEEVIGDYVSLKRKGQNFWANCPFHGEKTPSFSLSPAKQIYKCFGCGKAGDPIQFVMDI
ncbi:MAG: DNA primase, partial [Planctomycetota bacterium]